MDNNWFNEDDDSFDIRPIGRMMEEIFEPYKTMLEEIKQTAEKAMEVFKPVFDVVASFQNKIGTTIANGMKISKAIDCLGEAQYVQWEYLTTEFVDEIVESKNINKTLRIMYERSNYSDFFRISEECQKSKLVGKNAKILAQATDSFKKGHTDLVAIGITVVIDGTLANLPDSYYKKTSIIKRCERLAEKLDTDGFLDNEEFALLALALTFSKAFESIGGNSDFNGKEPNTINRHWTVHGRAVRRKTKLDCVKLIRFLYAIIILGEYLDT